jgi:hypothetical protein
MEPARAANLVTSLRTSYAVPHGRREHTELVVSSRPSHQSFNLCANLVAKRRTRHLRSQRAQMLEGRPIAGEAYANANIVVDMPCCRAPLVPWAPTSPPPPPRGHYTASVSRPRAADNPISALSCLLVHTSSIEADCVIAREAEQLVQRFARFECGRDRKGGLLIQPKQGIEPSRLAHGNELHVGKDQGSGLAQL